MNTSNLRLLVVVFVLSSFDSAPYQSRQLIGNSLALLLCQSLNQTNHIFIVTIGSASGRIYDNLDCREFVVMCKLHKHELDLGPNSSQAYHTANYREIVYRDRNTRMETQWHTIHHSHKTNTNIYVYMRKNTNTSYKN